MLKNQQAFLRMLITLASLVILDTNLANASTYFVATESGVENPLSADMSTEHTEQIKTLESGKQLALTAENLPIKSQEQKFAVRLAVVDVESIFIHSLAVKTIKKAIQHLSETISQELEQQEAELKNAERKLIQQQGVISEEDFAAKTQEFNKKVTAAQQIMQKRRAALERAHAEAISKVHKATIVIVHNLAKKHGFNIVLPSSQVVYVNNELNITPEVIALLNDSLTEVEIEYNLD